MEMGSEKERRGIDKQWRCAMRSIMVQCMIVYFVYFLCGWMVNGKMFVLHNKLGFGGNLLGSSAVLSGPPLGR